MPRYLGAHTVFNGGIGMAALRAGNAGMKALQIFTAPPQYYGDKATMRPDRVQRFRTALDQAGISPQHVVVHGAYVLNTATEDETKSARARAGLRKELERATALGVAGVCFHPGAAIGGERLPACRRVATAISEALEQVPGETCVWSRTRRARARPWVARPRRSGAFSNQFRRGSGLALGYGLDTCHLFSSGHDITKSATELKRILDDFEAATGESPSFFHLNDSEGALGSNKDRHVLIGEGKIGREPFRWLLQDPRTRDIPLILETPEKNYDIADDDPWPTPTTLPWCNCSPPCCRTTRTPSLSRFICHHRA